MSKADKDKFHIEMTRIIHRQFQLILGVGTVHHHSCPRVSRWIWLMKSSSNET